MSIFIVSGITTPKTYELLTGDSLMRSMDRMLTHEELIKLHGRSVTCFIQGVAITDAKISVEYDSVFICQNVADGATAKDKLGYKYSWSISVTGSPYCGFFDRDCSNLKLVEETNTMTKELETKLKSLEAELKSTLEELEKAKESLQFDKYGRLLKHKENTCYNYIDLNGVIEVTSTGNFNKIGNRFRNIAAAEFAIKVLQRDQILRKHGAEFPTEESQWCITAADSTQRYSGLGTKEFFQMYFATYEKAEEALAELKSQQLLNITPPCL